MKPAASRWIAWPIGWAFLLLAKPAWAHAFGKLYTLPVPVWLYMYGTSLALLFSLLILGFVLRHEQVNEGIAQQLPLGDTRPNKLGSLFAAALLLLCMATGWLGQPNPYFNLNMTLFWVVFLLGGLYWSACFGDFYSKINPFRYLYGVVGDRLGAMGFLASRAKGKTLRTSTKPLTEWPALLALVGLIWVELMWGLGPSGLAWLLVGYTLFNFFAASYWGGDQWFKRGELFAVMFGMAAKLAPIGYRHSVVVGANLRGPNAWFSPLLSAALPSTAAVFFILFLLSSTAFDGIKSITQWSEFYWGPFYNQLLPYTGLSPIKAYPFFKNIGLWFNTVSLLVVWAMYGLAYLLCLVAMRLLAPTPLTVLQLARCFAWSLLPIALAYHVAHYYTLLFSQGVQIFRLVVDPFGWGWNPFGVKSWLPTSWVLGASFVWHSQVAVILLGHVMGVYVAHVQALRLYPSRSLVLVSQLPMLLLMMGLTAFGLWIMAQPVVPGEGFS